MLFDALIMLESLTIDIQILPKFVSLLASDVQFLSLFYVYDQCYTRIVKRVQRSTDKTKLILISAQ